MSIRFEYACEKCGNEVSLTIAQHEAVAGAPRVARRRHNNVSRWGTRILCDNCDPAEIKKRDVHPESNKRRPPPSLASLIPVAYELNLSPSERHEYGITITAENTLTKRLVTVVGHGHVTAATHEAVEQIDALEGDWLVVSVSTPSSIFRDLQGMRTDQNTRLPETVALARIGRTDLLPPA